MTPRRDEGRATGRRATGASRAARLWLSIVGWSAWGLLGLVVAISAGSYIYLDDTLEAAAPSTPEAKAARRSARGAAGRAGQRAADQLGHAAAARRSRPRHADPGPHGQQARLHSMLSFPRDLLVNIPDVGQGKINSAYSYGAATTIKTVEA